MEQRFLNLKFTDRLLNEIRRIETLKEIELNNNFNILAIDMEITKKLLSNGKLPFKNAYEIFYEIIAKEIVKNYIPENINKEILLNQIKEYDKNNNYDFELKDLLDYLNEYNVNIHLIKELSEKIKNNDYLDEINWYLECNAEYELIINLKNGNKKRCIVTCGYEKNKELENLGFVPYELNVMIDLIKYSNKYTLEEINDFNKKQIDKYLREAEETKNEDDIHYVKTFFKFRKSLFLKFNEDRTLLDELPIVYLKERIPKKDIDTIEIIKITHQKIDINNYI